MIGNEAIKHLQHTYDFGEHTSIVKEALSMACNTLEKQIPKKPVDFGNEAYLCPNCRRNNFYDGTETLNKTNFCNYCGQALDWSDEE